MMDAPQREGFFWAKQKLTDHPDDVEIETIRSLNEWYVVEVFENHINDGEPDQWRVFVHGHGGSESIENFYWGEEIRR